jgi:high-affinity iron transporter
VIGTAVIVFRETLEAALIVSVVLAATRGIRDRGYWIGGGVAVGLFGAVLIAAGAEAIASAFEGVGQELFNAAVLIAAVVMLGWHQLWMAEHGRALAGQLRALGDAVRSGGQTLAALAVAVALAVLREGGETVLFLQGLATTEPKIEVAAGLVIGGLGGTIVGTLLYFGLVRIPVRHFFRVTGWLIVALAAGLAAQAARFLEQANVLPAIVPEVWDTSGVLSESSLSGQVMHVLVGYTAQPSLLQLIFYLATLAALISVGYWRASVSTGTRVVRAT